jgi:hypothetical protein
LNNGEKFDSFNSFLPFPFIPLIPISLVSHLPIRHTLAVLNYRKNITSQMQRFFFFNINKIHFKVMNTKNALYWTELIRVSCFQLPVKKAFYWQTWYIRQGKVTTLGGEE